MSDNSSAQNALNATGSKHVYVVVKHSVVDGITLSDAFHEPHNAQLFAECYGGSVRTVRIQEDRDVTLTAPQMGIIG